ncbi:MAG: prepilin peptidase [Acidobacteria bacterium]|nr:prepilin peptidase [Acidobacteriota bacterium]
MTIPADFPYGLVVFIFGLLIGSFLNVVIYRVPLGESIVLPASHCPHCNTPIKAYDNIPVLGYLWLGGKCRNCKVRISPIYPLVELLVGILFLLCYWKVSKQFSSFDQGSLKYWLAIVANVIFVALIVPLIFIDLRYKLLPDVITKPGLVLMLAWRAIAPEPIVLQMTRQTFHLMRWPDWAIALLGAAIGAVVGGGSLWLVREAYFRLKKIEGMGLGDIKMMFFVGAFLGWQLTVLTIFIASLLGSIVGITLIVTRGGNTKMEIPFGVFLGPAALLALFVGQSFINWYLGMFI